ncbi:Transposon Ty3-I Gag-Pol polyprotein [Ixodes scapularis]
MLSKAERNYSTTGKGCLAIVWAITKFRPYPYGSPFRVVTDHHSLCRLANLKDPSGRLARWSLRLQEFDMTVVYKSGRKHNDADCLSRAPVEAGPACIEDDDDECFLGTLDVSEMAALQRDDPELRALIEHLEGQASSVSRAFLRILHTFSMRQGVLYKDNFVNNNNTAWVLVFPASLRDEIFQGCHDDPTAGHLGYSRTLARIREKYYWPRLPKTVHLYIRSCHECQRRKKPPTKPSGLLRPISPPYMPFQQIRMDLLGPFPPSTSGIRWIIVATDYLTRYAETKALPAGTAVEVAKFFIESIVLRHGAPEVLITDRGSSFMAQLTQEILRLSGTGHRRTTAYHPQTNGLTERLNKTIADMISMYVDVEHKTWDEVLPYVTFAYNTAVQKTTGFTPFQLVHGRKVTTMLDAMLPHEPSDNQSDDAQVVAQRAEEVRQLARLMIQDQQRVDAGRYNLRRRDVHFQPGDRVWVWTPIRRRGLSEKLLKRYFGPYKVLRRLGELNYEPQTHQPATVAGVGEKRNRNVKLPPSGFRCRAFSNFPASPGFHFHASGRRGDGDVAVLVSLAPSAFYGTDVLRSVSTASLALNSTTPLIVQPGVVSRGQHSAAGSTRPIAGPQATSEFGR